jgi:hypothetical protein
MISQAQSRGLAGNPAEMTPELGTNTTSRDWYDVLRARLGENTMSGSNPRETQSWPQSEAPEGIIPAAYETSAGGKEIPISAEETSVDSRNSTSDSWQWQLARAVEVLERDLANGEGENGSTEKEVKLRLLYLATGRVQDSLRPIASLESTEQQFWASELYGLSSFIDQERIPDKRLRATYSNRELRQATTRLGELGSLDVRNLACCKVVESFGIYQRINDGPDILRPGQEILLYAEIENFVSQKVPEGFRTTLDARYEIKNERNGIVAQGEFEELSETCRNYRRDFFVHYRIRLADDLSPGRHTLHLFVNDLNGQKEGQSYVPFTVSTAAQPSQ